MHSLKPFKSTPEISLDGHIAVSGDEIVFRFQLQDSRGLLSLPDTFETTGAAPREDNLWQGTCFEAFLSPVGRKEYYEFNFSLNPAWNAYHFDEYRKPQPPVATSAFGLIGISWRQPESQLTVKVRNSSGHLGFKVGLAAVLREKTDQKHYFALVHAAEKPDFHLAQSFTLIL